MLVGAQTVNTREGNISLTAPVFLNVVLVSVSATRSYLESHRFNQTGEVHVGIHPQIEKCGPAS